MLLGVGMGTGRSKSALVGLVLIAAATSGCGSSATSSSSPRSPTKCQAVRALNVQRDDKQPVSQGSVTAIVIGDSYAQGFQLTDPRDSFPKPLGQAEHWTTYVQAIGETGFVNGGYCGGQEYATRVQQALAAHPSVVIVQGGLNDYASSERQEQLAAASLLRSLTAVKAVIMVGPSGSPVRPQSKIMQVDRALATASANAGRAYVRLIDVPLPYGPDGLHPTAAGQRIIAAHIESSLTH